MPKNLEKLRCTMIYNAYTEQNEKIAGITLVCCGHIFAKPGREINRPNGRDDWLLFYIAKESETFYLNETKVGQAGSFIIFAPHEKQHHIYLGDETAEFYYIHFKCEQLPSDISLTTSKVYHAPFSRSVCNIFENIFEELQCKKLSYEKLCIYKLLQLFTILEREINLENQPDRYNYDRIALAIQHMNKCYNSDFTLEDYAHMCSLSKYHFLRTFEKIVGCTPIEYRNNIRLQQAEDFLVKETLAGKGPDVALYMTVLYFPLRI